MAYRPSNNGDQTEGPLPVSRGFGIRDDEVEGMGWKSCNMAVMRWVNHDDFPTVVVDDAIDGSVLRRMRRCEDVKSAAAHRTIPFSCCCRTPWCHRALRDTIGRSASDFNLNLSSQRRRTIVDIISVDVVQRRWSGHVLLSQPDVRQSFCACTCGSFRPIRIMA